MNSPTIAQTGLQAPCISNFSKPTLTTLKHLATLFRGEADAAFLTSLTDSEWFALFVVINADRHRLGPALYCILTQPKLAKAVPQDALNYLADLASANVSRNAAVRGEVVAIVTALNTAGVEPMLLKGSAALMKGGPAAAERLVGDIDLLVPAGSEAAALTAMREIGFQVKVSPTASHNIADLERRGDYACVDLHREVLDRKFRYLLPAEIMFLKGRSIDSEGLRFFLPAVQHNALHIMLHAQLHHGAYYNRQFWLSTSRDLVNLSKELDWTELESWADVHQMRLVLEATLLPAEQFFGLTWPLSKMPSQTAIMHHKRACQVEITGRWDTGLSQLARIREALASDRLSVEFGADHWYPTNLARCGLSALRRHSLRELWRRLSSG